MPTEQFNLYEHEVTELVNLAEYLNIDKDKLIEAVHKEHKDFYAYIASVKCGKPYDVCLGDPYSRNIGRICVFGYLYGRSPVSILEVLNIQKLEVGADIQKEGETEND